MDYGPPRRNSRKAAIVIILVFVSLVLLWNGLHNQAPTETRRYTKRVKQTAHNLYNPDAIHIQLHNGVRMPVIGFGTAALSNPEFVIETAVKSGYRLLDTASDTGPWYHTERVISKVLRKNDVQRADIFITTKLHPQDHGTSSAMASFKKSLENLESDYIDLYLLHYPRCSQRLCSKDPEGTWKDSWRVLESLYKEGKVRSIGVSNFRLADLKQLLSFATIKPHVVQNWFDPFHQDWELIHYCWDNNIVFQAYSPLGTQWRKRPNPVLTNSLLLELSQRYNRRWMIQEGIPTVPRSNKEEHIRQNIQVFGFELSAEDMKRIRNLNGQLS